MPATPRNQVKHTLTHKKPSKPRAASGSRVCRVPRPGQKCDQCGKGKLAYDGLLQLGCPVCGYVAAGGGFT